MKKILLWLLLTSFVIKIFTYFSHFLDDSSTTINIPNNLEPSCRHISDEHNLLALIKNRQNDYIKFIIKYAPHSPNITDVSINSAQPHQKLASLLLELFIWDQVILEIRLQVEDHVWTQIEDQVKIQVKNQPGVQIWDQVREDVIPQLNVQVLDELKYRVVTKIEKRSWEQLSKEFFRKVVLLFSHQINDLVRPEINDYFSQTELAPAYHQAKLKEALNPAIGYTFMVYQSKAIAIRNSQEFRTLQNDLSKFVLKRISDEQAYTILDNIEFPNYTVCNYLLDAQLKLIKRHLPSES